MIIFRKNDFTQHVFIEELGFRMSALPIASVCDWHAMWLGGLCSFLIFDRFLGKLSSEGSTYDGVSDVMRHLETVGYVQPVEPRPVVKNPHCIHQISYVS